MMSERIFVEVRVDQDTQYLSRIETEEDVKSLNRFIRAEMAKRQNLNFYVNIEKARDIIGMDDGSP